MARVTIEDCVEKVSSRFELVAVAAQRAKSIASGAPLTIDRDGEKNTVLSLREIAFEKVDTNELRDELVRTYQRQSDFDDLPEAESAEDKSLLDQEIEDMAPVMAGEAAPAPAEEGMFSEENLEVDD